MTDNWKSTKDDGQAGGALQKLAISATDAFVESVSSLAGSAVEEGANRLNDFSLNVCREHLDRLVCEQSVVTAAAVDLDEGFGGKVTMSPMIFSMLKVCQISVVAGGCTWVVCAPTDQGKTLAAQFLIHGNHSVRPNRSIKIDATNMTDFAKDFAAILNCSAAESCLSQLLCEALSDSATIVGNGEGKIAKATAKATNIAGQYLCIPGKATAFSTKMEMRDAEQHKILMVKTRRKGGKPSPILIIDEFYLNTEKNKAFIRTLLRDAAAKGVTVFLMTKERDWASELIELNDGAKCKPLPYNVDNVDYTGAKKFVGPAQWNDLTPKLVSSLR
jgi:hypothetical protein